MSLLDLVSSTSAMVEGVFVGTLSLIKTSKKMQAESILKATFLMDAK